MVKISYVGRTGAADSCIVSTTDSLARICSAMAIIWACSQQLVDDNVNRGVSRGEDIEKVIEKEK